MSIETAELAKFDQSISALERGIIISDSTTISLLGIDVLGIKHLKVITTLDTWFHCPEIW
ncbi:MAG TPA: hypothetical protein VHY08_27335 [Bacillota bacterium]|nr:hypothetical protein [Bacillota bacterium]